ncbi:HIG1 domain family member 2A, mitochondrial [Vespa crabro]|uniref:HIG1 domain family member 2A, mitochondrial n=1 Tax=Vespa crabro TaxID=7445 RepID=UPI001F005C90|nr:HIG1 domain family member 2A, mitochondrial [Vespa crabro]
MAKDTYDNNDLDWLKIREVDAEEYPVGQLAETPKEKLFRKVRENPFVPLGTLATVSALTYGLYNFSIGNTKLSQYMMRTRVAAQAFTFIAIITGLMLTQNKINSKT